MVVSVPYRNSIVAGTALVRDAINSPGYIPGVSGWTINKDGTAEFNDLSLRGSLVVTGSASSSNYVAGTSGWTLNSNGSAEFNGNVDMMDGRVTGTLESANYAVGSSGWSLNSAGSAEFNGNVNMLSGTVTGAMRSTNYVAGNSGWSLNSNGTAEFNGNIVTALTDGKVATGANVDTANNVLNTRVAVGSGNPQNTAQIAGHGYMALVQVDVHTDAGPTRLRYSLWNGAVGGTQIGTMTPIMPLSTATAGAANGRFETHTMMFVWSAASTTTIANVNLAYEQLVPGGAANPTFTRVGTSSFAFIIWDLGLATQITNL